VPGGSDALTGAESFINNQYTITGRSRAPFARRDTARDPGRRPDAGPSASPNGGLGRHRFRAMHRLFRAANYPSEIRQPILMLAASNDTSSPHRGDREFAYHLRAGSHLLIAGSKHEILQEAGPATAAQVLGRVRRLRAWHAVCSSSGDTQFGGFHLRDAGRRRRDLGMRFERRRNTLYPSW